MTLWPEFRTGQFWANDLREDASHFTISSGRHFWLTIFIVFVIFVKKPTFLELQKRHENQKKKLELEFAEMDQKRREFEREKAEFDDLVRQWEQKNAPSDKKKKQKQSLF